MIKALQQNETLRMLGGMALLLKNTFRELFTAPFYFRLFLEQLQMLAVQSLPLILITGLASGAVVAYQMGFGMERFGAKLYVPNILALALLREMCPVFASLMVSSRVGSTIAAEVGSMAVTQQIDAIRALGTSPIKKIVIPRLLAAVVGLPLLVVFCAYAGFIAGMFISVSEMGITPLYFLRKVREVVGPADIVICVGKTLVFSVFIVLSGCYWGLQTKGGTKGVGETTTKVTVSSATFIYVSDVFLTKFFFMVTGL